LKWLRHCDRRIFAPSVIALSDGILREELNRLEIPNIIFPKQRAFDLPFLGRLIKQIRQMAPDVIHCRNGIPAISYGVLAARIARVPVVCSIHGRTHYIQQNIKTWLWFRIMRLSQTIITVTEGIGEEVSRYGNIPRDKVKMIHNGIDLTGQAPAFSRENVRKESGFSRDDFLIGTVGNLRAIKGQKYLVQAMPEILSKIGRAKIVLIGSGEEQENLQKLAAQLHISDKIKFLGYRENAGRLIGMFDIFALPSLSEGFPNVLLEAMMAQIPIVATRVGGVGEIVIDGQEALLVGHADSGALARAVVRLSENPVLRETLAANALRRVQDQFDIRTTLAQYDAVYLSLTVPRTSPSLQKHS
jgi:glycosyltransferase involved in cell wall biosynthesis